MWCKQSQPHLLNNFYNVFSSSVVKELVRHGSKKEIDLISDEDDDSNTALHLACIYGHYAVAKVLLESGADPDSR